MFHRCCVDLGIHLGIIFGSCWASSGGSATWQKSLKTCRFLFPNSCSLQLEGSTRGSKEWSRSATGVAGQGRARPPRGRLRAEHRPSFFIVNNSKTGPITDPCLLMFPPCLLMFPPCLPMCRVFFSSAVSSHVPGVSSHVPGFFWCVSLSVFSCVCICFIDFIHFH